MQITDSIADMLTRIRNGATARHATVDVPASNLKKTMQVSFCRRGTFSGWNSLRTTSRCHSHHAQVCGKKPVISGLKRISKPGLRVYSDSENLPRVLGGLGIAIVSTSSGIMTDRAARQKGIGGEVLAYVW